MIPLKQLLLILTVVTLVGCGESDAEKAKAAAEARAVAEAKAAADWEVIEAAVCKELKKPTGELTKANLEEVTRLILGEKRLAEVPKGLKKLNQLRKLHLRRIRLTDVKDLEKLAQLKELHLSGIKLTEVPKGLEKLTQLNSLGLSNNKLTDVKDLEKLDQLRELGLYYNPDLTKAQIDQLQKALPKCTIYSNPTK